MKMEFSILFAIVLTILISKSLAMVYDPELQKTAYSHDNKEETSSFWIEQAQATLKKTLQLRHNENVAKNIIFFLGDGMGVTTVTAARIFKGQLQGRSGEEEVLEFEKFPNVGLVKTYNVNHQVPDSAGTATAFLCGVKANYYTVGVDASARLKDCNSTIGAEVSSLLTWAQEAGKDTGFITTTRVTHATPAGLYAHSADRYWEADSEMPSNASRCKDIGRQLVENAPGKNAKIIMGGGRKRLTPPSVIDPLKKKPGVRADGKNLIENWITDKKERGVSHKYLQNKEDFDKWDPLKTDYTLGLFDYDHLDYDSNRSQGPDGQPSLAEMVKKAITALKKSNAGFFLFVEGGRIDHAHHLTLMRHALEEVVALDEAVKVAVDSTDEKDTIIVVTADHSHVLTLNGYPNRGNPILGLNNEVSDSDHMPYTTLMYTNGPNFDGRTNLTNVKTYEKTFHPQVAVPMIEETHGGEDVAVYARGPMGHLLHGIQEQNYIPHAIAYAACIGMNKDHCKSKPKEKNLAVSLELNRIFFVVTSLCIIVQQVSPLSIN